MKKTILPVSDIIEAMTENPHTWYPQMTREYNSACNLRRHSPVRSASVDCVLEQPSSVAQVFHD